MNERYQEALLEAHNSIEAFKKELISFVKTNCKTYSEVTYFLHTLKKKEIWGGKRVIPEAIEEVKDFFEKEKNSLSVK